MIGTIDHAYLKSASNHHVIANHALFAWWSNPETARQGLWIASLHKKTWSSQWRGKSMFFE